MLKDNLEFFKDHPISVGQKQTNLSDYEILESNYSDVFETAIKHKKIALLINDPQLFYFFLTHLDGIVDEVLILSQVFSNGDIKSFFSETQISCCVSDLDSFDLFKDITWVNTTKVIDNKNSVALQEEKKSTLWIIPTSGTTNRPKLIKHSTDSLISRVKVDKEKGKELIWGNLYDHTRFAGIQVLLQGLIGGSTLVLDNKSNIEEKLNALIENHCNALSGTPTIWRNILMLPSAKELKLKQITLGGEIIDQAILNSLRKIYPNARITHIYALTEIGVAFSVSDSRAGFPIEFLNEEKIKSKIKISESNTLLIKPSLQNVDPHIKEKLDSNGYFNTEDIVKVIEDRVYFYGRDNKCINVGGHKVHPEEIEQFLLRHDKIQSVRILAKENPIVGNLIIAEIVASNISEEDQPSVKKELKEYCLSHFPKYKVPYQFKFVNHIEYNKTGKINRNGV
ncbi:MAG: ANL family adenylate-forming protein [Candidatus Marinamargulisbacteria bacterium]